MVIIAHLQTCCITSMNADVSSLHTLNYILLLLYLLLDISSRKSTIYCSINSLKMGYTQKHLIADAIKASVYVYKKRRAKTLQNWVKNVLIL